MDGLLLNYTVKKEFYDEVFVKDGLLRTHYHKIFSQFNRINFDYYKLLNQEAKLSFLNQGITYTLYSENETKESIFPFDLFPRVIQPEEWKIIEKGLDQRNRALNTFIGDVYGDQMILKDGIVPKELVLSSKHYVKLMEKFRPPGDIYTHISGTDLIRHSDGNFYVLEDNLRSPSGISYVLSNRQTLIRTLPGLFRDNRVQEVNSYPLELLTVMESVAPVQKNQIKCVLLTPGQYNSAYFEHSFLARKMGIDLVEGQDLYIEDEKVYLKTIGRKQQVDVIYRRIDDDFLDPAVFNPKSMLGVSGLMNAYLKGNITIVNAPGTGISDDKAICAYVPDMIKYYLGEDPILPNVPTYICGKEKDLNHALEHLKDLVVKPVDLSGGYGVVIADTLSKSELVALKEQIQKNPRDFIAQPKMLLSTHSTYIEDSNTMEPRHIDLRTFTLTGKDYQYILPGGLSRVALKKGSLIVNSSQGGGSKDTWVVA